MKAQIRQADRDEIQYAIDAIASGELSVIDPPEGAGVLLRPDPTGQAWTIGSSIEFDDETERKEGGLLGVAFLVPGEDWMTIGIAVGHTTRARVVGVLLGAAVRHVSFGGKLMWSTQGPDGLGDRGDPWNETVTPGSYPRILTRAALALGGSYAARIGQFHAFGFNGLGGEQIAYCGTKGGALTHA